MRSEPVNRTACGVSLAMRSISSIVRRYNPVARFRPNRATAS